MRKKQNDSKVKQYVSKYEDNPGDSGSVSAHGGNNPSDVDAGELRRDAGRLSGAWKAFIMHESNAFGMPKNILYFLCIFSLLVNADYLLTIYAIRQHFSEFNPLTVSIYRNFQNPESVFLLFKLAVIGLNGFLIYLLLKLKSQKKIFGKIALAYVMLAAFFASAVVVYDVGIISGTLALPEFANEFIFSFFKFFGMV